MMPAFLSTYNSPISIARAKHYQQLISLWECAVRATHHFLSEEDISQYRLLIHDYYFDRLKLFCYRKDKKIAGFIGVSQGDIQLLFVMPGHMGLGIGTVLVEFAVKKLGAKTVNVNVQNTAAIDFYTKLSFEPTGICQTDSAGKPFPVMSMKLRSVIPTLAKNN